MSREPKKVISLKDILDKSDYPNAGSRIFTIMDEFANSSEVIVLDMEGVVSIPTMFMNTSLAAYIDKYGVKELRERLRFRNISKAQAERVIKYLSDYEEIIKTR